MQSLRQAEQWQPVQSDALWTEFLYFYAYDPRTQVGLSTHIGRCAFDRDLWRAIYMLFLPGDELLVGKAFGRQQNPWRLELGPFTISALVPGELWTLEFEGAAQRVTRRDSISRPHRDGIDESLRFQLAFQGAAPCWDHRKSIEGNFYASMHFEQICRVSGAVAFGGKTTEFDGMGVRDHSTGVRDYSTVHGDFWSCALFPDGKSLMASVIRTDHGMSNAGYIHWGEAAELELVTVSRHPIVPCRAMKAGSVPHDPIATEALRKFDFGLTSSRGLIVVEGELLHCGAATFVAPSSELLGTHAARTDALQWTECVAKFRWGDQIGYGIRERIAPIATLDVTS